MTEKGIRGGRRVSAITTTQTLPLTGIVNYLLAHSADALLSLVCPLALCRSTALLQ